ncbi:hypothetical protein AN643_04700 [Candidatus Epulonipiscioides saccharophilum]|nr:hypothetical protein AN643_04700 [Epulopiscium sp. SCG-B10WGA-EpuloB]
MRKTFCMVLGISMIIGMSTTLMAKERDLDGLTVTVVNWTDVVEPEEKSTTQEELLWEYRHEMMDTHNFNYETKGLAQWNTSLELLATSTMAGEPAGEIFRIHANSVLVAKNSGLLFDLATLDSIDLKDPKWSQTLQSQMTVGDSVYGIATASGPTFVLYYNKRLFEEAGLDGDLPYDLQAMGEWTWDAFVAVSEQITRDKDNDGENDVYAITVNHATFLNCALFSNDGSYVAQDENGNLFYNLGSPNSMEAFEWTNAYWKTDNDIYPSRYNGQKELFTSGKAAMYIAKLWEAKTLTEELMPDDWGMVAFPKGPKADNYSVVYSDDAYVIPNSYTKEEAEDIIFAYDIFTDSAPGYDGPDDWMIAQYPNFRDERAVEESMALLKSPGVGKIDYSIAMAGMGVSTGKAAQDIYFNRMTPAEAVESQASMWQAAIDKINATNPNNVPKEVVEE